MNSWERLERTFLGQDTDRTPLLGGWISCPDHIQKITGVDAETYWKNPQQISVDAYRKLQMDGLIDILVPKNRNDFRIVDANSYRHADNGMSLEDALDWIEKSPQASEIENSFNFEAEYGKYRAALIEGRELCADMVYMPALWGGGARLQWYDDFGYENFFIIVGAYPDHAKKMIEIGGAQGYCKSRLVAQAVKEGLYPHALLLGEDICSQQAPMVSPEFLEEFYAPVLKRGLEPLLEAGCRPVWHSDGNVRPIMDMLINCGIQGFQGFQIECGVTLEFVLEHRTRDGEPLIIFGPLAVTTELPVFSPPEVKRRVKEAIQLCRGNARLVLFTSNTINPDIPLENIYAMYEAALEG
jgi:hypothetical protein